MYKDENDKLASYSNFALENFIENYNVLIKNYSKLKKELEETNLIIEAQKTRIELLENKNEL